MAEIGLALGKHEEKTKAQMEGATMVLVQKVDGMADAVKKIEDLAQEVKKLETNNTENMKKMSDMEAMIKKNGEGQSERSDGKWQHKDAKDIKPGNWDESMAFMDLMIEVRTWTGTLHEDYPSLMDRQEKDVKTFITSDNVNSNDRTYPDFKKMDKLLWNMLITCIKGPGKTYMLNPSESGFQGWAQLVQHFDPRSGVDKTLAYSRIVNPVMVFGQANDTSQARQIMLKWEEEKAQYVKKFCQIDEEAQKLGLKSIMPKSMFGESGAFRGRSYDSYDELRKEILGFVEDKPIPGAQGQPSNSDVNNMDDKNNKEEFGEWHGEWREEEDIAYMWNPKGKGKGKYGGGGKGYGKYSGKDSQYLGGGKGYGKFGGKDNQAKGAGKNTGCFNCGGEHYARDCPTSAKAKGEGKTCYSCGKTGHIARDCWSDAKGQGKGLNNIEGDEQKEENHESDGHLWSLVNGSGAEKEMASGSCTGREIVTQNRFEALEERDAIKTRSRRKSPSSGSEFLTVNCPGTGAVTCQSSSDCRPGLNEKSLQSPRKGRVESRLIPIDLTCQPCCTRTSTAQPCCEQSKEKDMRPTLQNLCATPKAKMPRWNGNKKKVRNLLGCLEEAGTAEPDCIMACEDQGYKWVKEEAAVDSGAVDCVANGDRFPHLEVMETPESMRGEHWTCAGGKQLKKEGEITLDWITNEGHGQKTKIKIGKVNRTLISADKLLEKGHEVILSKRNPRIITKNGQVIALQRKYGMFILEMWHKVPNDVASSVFTRRGS